MIGTPYKTCTRSSSSTRNERWRELIQRLDPVRSWQGEQTEEVGIADLLITLKQNDSPALVSSGKVVTR